LNRKLLSALVAGSMFISLSSAQAATTLMQIGLSPFYQPPLTTTDSLVSMVDETMDDLKKGFEKAGRPDLFEPFAVQLKSARIESVDYGKGTTFEWMFFKKKGKGTVRVAKEVTWGNDTTFPGFQFDVESDGKVYTFVVPLGCGNIALMGMRDVPAPVVVAPPVPNKAPDCSMTVAPVQAFCGELVTVDATASTDTDGTVTGMKINVTDASGQAVQESQVDTGLVGQVTMPCGTNTVSVTVMDNEGDVATCTSEVTGISRTRFLADLGYYNMPDPGNYLFGRVGLEYKINENWGLIGMVGGAPHISGDDGVSAFLVDFLGEYSFSRYYIDFGLGGWITDGDDDLETENSQLDLVAGFGARVYGEPEEFNASLFVEVRAATDELDDFVDFGRFGFGVRLKF
jgi:hypothetical protein